MADYLIKSDYQIVGRNHLSKIGEIDIIAAKDGVIHFIEVKAKSSTLFGQPAEMVNRRKRQKLAKLAQLYMLRHPDTPFQIDVAEVMDGQVKLIENALF